MKKEVFIFLLTMPIVYAQSITLGSRSYSPFFIAPLVLILLAILVFLGIFIKDHLPKFKAPNIKIKKRKLKKEVKKEIQELPETDYHKESLIFAKKIKTLPESDALKQLSGLIKEYAYNILEIKHELTHEELVAQVEKKKPQLKDILEKTLEYKYSGKAYTKEDIKLLSEQFTEITEPKKHIPIPKPEKRLDTLKQIFIGRQRSINEFIQLVKNRLKPIKKTPQISKREIKRFKVRLEEEKPKILKVFNPVTIHFQKKKINKILKKAIKNIHQIPEARKAYSQALTLYYQLPIEQEKEYGISLVNLYNQIEKEKLNQESEKLELLTQQLNQVTDKGGVVTKEEKHYLNKLKDSLSVFSKYKKEWTKNIYKKTVPHISQIEHKWSHNLHEREHKILHNIKFKVNNLKQKEHKVKEKEEFLKQDIKQTINKEKIEVKQKLFSIKNKLTQLQNKYEKRKQLKFNIELQRKKSIEKIKIEELKYPTLEEQKSLEKIHQDLENLKDYLELYFYRLKKNEIKLIHSIQDILQEIDIKRKEGSYLLHKSELALLDKIHKKLQPKLITPEKVILPQFKKSPHLTKPINRILSSMKNIQEHGSHKLHEHAPIIRQSLKEMISISKIRGTPISKRLISLDELQITPPKHIKLISKALEKQELSLVSKMVNLENLKRQQQMQEALQEIEKPKIKPKIELPKVTLQTSKKAIDLSKQELELENKMNKLENTRYQIQKEQLMDSFHKVKVEEQPDYGWIKKATETRYRKTDKFKKLSKEEKQLFTQLDKIAISS